MVNWFLSILVHKAVLTEEEAAHLSKELVLKVHPTGFAEAHKIIEKLFKEL